MTTLLSSVPVIKRLDSWILAAFLEWGSIPAEVRRRAATMAPKTFSVTVEDVANLRDSYGDGSYGSTLAGHLREHGSDRLELSEYRFTRVVKLYDRVQSLSGQPRYARFFAEAADEFSELNQRMTLFLGSADTSLTLASRLRTVQDEAAYEELMQDRREAFAQSCRDIFQALALFLARAVLRSEPTEKEIVRRLREVGFAAAEPMNEPEFPINSLTVLALGIFAYLAVLTLFYSHLSRAPETQGDALLMALNVALARLITIGVVVWLMQRFSFFRRTSGAPQKYFAYVLCGIIASAVAAGVCLPFALSDHGGLIAGIRSSLPLIFLSGMLCSVVALCCDDWPDDSAPPIWVRFVEAGSCAAVMLFGTSFIYFGDMLPASMGVVNGWMAVSWIALPSAMALVIGGIVPHVYRSARRAAAATRNEAVPPSEAATGKSLLHAIRT
jgi:hypothetical protein